MTIVRTSICKDERGTSLIEMGLVAPILATLLIGMVDISRAYSERLQLEQAAQRTIERVMQRNVGSTEASIEAALAAEAANAAEVDQSAVEPRAWLECSSNGGTSWSAQAYDSTCPEGQSYARYALVTIQKPFTPLFGTSLFPGANADGTFTLSGEAGIRIQ